MFGTTLLNLVKPFIIPKEKMKKKHLIPVPSFLAIVYIIG